MNGDRSYDAVYPEGNIHTCRGNWVREFYVFDGKFRYYYRRIRVPWILWVMFS